MHKQDITKTQVNRTQLFLRENGDSAKHLSIARQGLTPSRLEVGWVGGSKTSRRWEHCPAHPPLIWKRRGNHLSHHVCTHNIGTSQNNPCKQTNIETNLFCKLISFFVKSSPFLLLLPFFFDVPLKDDKKDEGENTRLHTDTRRQSG